MVKLIKAKISSNYNDRKISGDRIEVYYSSQDDCGLWFNINLGNERDDDYATVSVELNELLEAIGKAIENPED